MTQKQLGEVLGFPGKTSDVRMAQYESEARVPRHNLVEEYDQWRYKYPKLDTSQHWAKVPSQADSDMLMEELAKIEKEELGF